MLNTSLVVLTIIYLKITGLLVWISMQILSKSNVYTLAMAIMSAGIR